MQLDFFPEEIKVLESDAIDISTIEFDPTLAKGKQIVRDWLYSEVVTGKYFLYKTGGINRWHQDKGQTFPYLQNKHTGNIIKPTQVGIGYPVININVGGTTKIIQMHRLVGEAFIINPDPKIRTIVHHKNNIIDDWSVDNLWWITKKENSLLKQKKKKEPDQLSMNRMFSGGGFVG